MLTDGTEPQTELQRRNSETVAADRSERFDSGLEASYADEERMDTSEPNSFEDSAIHGPREDYECEEMVDADSDRAKDDTSTDNCRTAEVHSAAGKSNWCTSCKRSKL